MERYTLTTEGKKCSLKDNIAGVTVDWEQGSFNASQQFSYTDRPITADTASHLAAVCREMGDYLAANHPELI